MRQTLFIIPHEIAGWPVFGFGWALFAWCALSALLLAWMIRRHGWNDETRGFLPFVAMMIFVLWWVLPRVEVMANGVPLGLPIRGYGMMLLLAVVTGVGLAVYRARQVGLDPEIIYSLAFAMFVSGIAGARLFYVIEYWSELREVTVWGTLRNILNFVEGGLVVYGSLIGAMLAAAWFFKSRRLPILAMGDLIAPSLAIGLAIGRLGCLMNGCCYGGLCDQPWAITFPAISSPGQTSESPPYMHQHRLGMLHGIRLSMNAQRQVIVAEVFADGAAAQSDVQAGVVVQGINGYRVTSLGQAEELLGGAGPEVELTTERGDVAWSVGQLPVRSLPVHPTQIYAAVNAGLLALLTYAWFPFRRRDGQVIAALFTLYPISRFMLEIIRVDEIGFLQTGLTISQNVSMGLLTLAGGIWWYVIWFSPPLVAE